MPKASKTSPKKSPVQMSLTAPVKKVTKKAPTKKTPEKKTTAKASAPAKSFTKESLPKTALLPAKKAASKSTKKNLKKTEIEKLDKMEHEIEELEKDVADVSYSMSSMLLVIVVVALMALIGYIYSMRAEPVVVTMESAPEVSVQSQNLSNDVIDAVLTRVSTTAGIEPGDMLLSANRVVTAPAGQTYQVGDYIFVFNTKIIVYRAEVNQIVGVASFDENKTETATATVVQ